MKRTLLLAIAVYMAFVLDAAGTGIVGLHGPSWLAIAAALCVWSQPLSAGVLSAGACGLLMDSLGSGPMGLQLAVLGTTGWLLGILRRHQRWRSTAVLIVLTFGMTSASTAAGLLIETPRESWTFDFARRSALEIAGPSAVTALWAGAIWCSVVALGWGAGWMALVLRGKRAVTE